MRVGDVPVELSCVRERGMNECGVKNICVKR